MINIQRRQAPPVASGPVDHLIACHRRIEQRLDTFERAAAALADRPAEALEAIRSSVRFMDLSGALHTIDEEESFFPRLREVVDEQDRLYLERLEAEHREADQVYHRLKAVALELESSATPERIERYRQTVSELASRYRKHIASEDEILTSLAARALTPSQLEAIQAEMRQRRQ